MKYIVEEFSARIQSEGWTIGLAFGCTLELLEAEWLNIVNLDALNNR